MSLTGAVVDDVAGLDLQPARLSVRRVARVRARGRIPCRAFVGVIVLFTCLSAMVGGQTFPFRIRCGLSAWRLRASLREV